MSRFIKSKEADLDNFFKQLYQMRIEYKAHLNVSIDCIRFLLCQGLAFRGDHDESRDLKNQGNLLKLLKFIVNHIRILEVLY